MRQSNAPRALLEGTSAPGSFDREYVKCCRGAGAVDHAGYMRRFFAAVLGTTLIVSGCGTTWHPAQHEGYSGAHVLTVTADRAYELVDARIDSVAVAGAVIAVWKVTQLDGGYLDETDEHLRRGDSPETIAQVLKWPNVAPLEQRTSIPFQEIRYLRVYDSADNHAVAGILGLTLVTALLMFVHACSSG